MDPNDSMELLDQVLYELESIKNETRYLLNTGFVALRKDKFFQDYEAKFEASITEQLKADIGAAAASSVITRSYSTPDKPLPGTRLVGELLMVDPKGKVIEKLKYLEYRLEKLEDILKEARHGFKA